jgi:hypothetical protein
MPLPFKCGEILGVPYLSFILFLLLFLLFFLFEAMICGYIRNQEKVDEKLEQIKYWQRVATFRVALAVC